MWKLPSVQVLCSSWKRKTLKSSRVKTYQSHLLLSQLISQPFENRTRGLLPDTVTSDVVGTWAATPTWATNWADNATPADLTVTSSWTTVKVENIAIDESTVNNLALVIWLPNEETIGDIVYISQVQMNMGSVAPLSTKVI